MTIFKTKYNPPVCAVFKSDKPSQTKSEFKDDCTFSRIIERFTKTGFFYDPLSPVCSMARKQNAALQPLFIDLPHPDDMEKGIEVMRDAQSRFDKLPAGLRAAFSNNPEVFLAVMSDKEKLSSLIKSRQLPPDLFGILKQKPKEPVVVEPKKETSRGE